MPRLVATIKTRDGLCPASLFTPAEGAGPWPAVIFFMDGLGIRPLGRDVDAIIVDFHCEATGEKQAMGKRRAANATGAAALRPHGRTPREPLIFQFTDIAHRLGTPRLSGTRRSASTRSSCSGVRRRFCRTRRGLKISSSCRNRAMRARWSNSLSDRGRLFVRGSSGASNMRAFCLDHYISATDASVSSWVRTRTRPGSIRRSN